MESLIINDVRWELEVKPTLGRQLIMDEHYYYCAMWQTQGTKRIHLYSIKYGKTENEARSAMDETIQRLLEKNIF